MVSTVWQEEMRTRRDVLLLAAILAAILILRIAALAVSKFDFAYDEAQYWLWSRELAFGYYSKPPLIGWAMRLASALCGEGVFCLRLPAAVLPVASAALLYALGRALYDRRVAFWSAILYATLPGAAVASMLFTTDAPLLFFWSAALLLLVHQQRRPNWATAVLLGLAVGLGLNAKYAMIYLPLCTALYVAVTPQARGLVRAPSSWGALAIALACLLPNLWWNWQNGFATARHTANDNMAWDLSRLNPAEPFEFLLGQAGIIGPILFAVLIYMLATGRRSRQGDADRFLLLHSVPIIAAIMVQGFLSHTHGNWAATAYPGATVLLAAFIVHNGMRRLLAAAVALNAAVSALLLLPGAFADRPLVMNAAPGVRRMVGWDEFAVALERVIAPTGIRTVVADGKPLSAQLTYYLRDSGLTVKSLTERGSFPDDHYQLTRPWHPDEIGPVVLVTARPPDRLPIAADRLKLIGTIDTAIYLARKGRLPIYRVDP